MKFHLNVKEFESNLTFEDLPPVRFGFIKHKSQPSNPKISIQPKINTPAISNNNRRKIDVVSIKNNANKASTGFMTAGDQLRNENPEIVPKRRALGISRPQKFTCPFENKQNSSASRDSSTSSKSTEISKIMAKLPPNIDEKMVEMIMSEICSNQTVDWNDICGLEHAKKTIQEIVVMPMLRPDLFTGLRSPSKGLLLFGPPGTGKTLIGKCIASQSKATFFSISSSSLTSKWIGEGEKMVRTLFALARSLQPSVIFIDEIDSLLSQRQDGENEANRRIKTEFLVQFDGCGTNSEDRVLLIGATNRPHEIDEAARRRFTKKLYIPLPDGNARKAIIQHLLKKQSHELNEEHVDQIMLKTDGYSGSDVDGLCREAALGPIRDIGNIETVSLESVRPISLHDFIDGLRQVRASVSQKDLQLYVDFDREYGSFR